MLTSTRPIKQVCYPVIAMQKLLPPLLLLCTLGALSAQADTVYKSIDETGAVSFSDTPPEQGVTAETLEIITPQPSSTEDSLANLEAMRETTDRMAADRREREKHRAEMRELNARTQASQQAMVDTTDYVDYYYPIYTGYNNRPHYPHRPPYRPPGLRPKPEHPIARPPLRARSGGSASNNSQLMRPITSGRR